jgi:hypothetical protein
MPRALPVRRALAMVLVGGLLLGFGAPAAEAHGWGLGAAVVGLATFAVLAPIVVAGSVIAHVVPPPVYAPPPGYAPPPAYAPPPVTYAPAPAYAPPPVTYAPAPAYSAPASSAPAAPTSYRTRSASVNVVQYSNGRYVLRGDGVTTAYQWVWIPNPPPPPPARPPQVANTGG